MKSTIAATEPPTPSSFQEMEKQHYQRQRTGLADSYDLTSLIHILSVVVIALGGAAFLLPGKIVGTFAALLGLLIFYLAVLAKKSINVASTRLERKTEE